MSFLTSIGGARLHGSGLIISGLERIDSVQLQVSIRWDHSWYLDSLAPGNHDAVWLWGKYQNAAGEWMPLRFNPDMSLYFAGFPLKVVPEADQMGVWIRRQQVGAGSLPLTHIQLRLAQPLDASVQAIRLMGVEMVWVRPGPFWVGDSSSLYRLESADTAAPFCLKSEAALALGPGATGLNADSVGLEPGILGVDYPKGVQGFYAMKYELTQAQYRDFLNCLSYSQQVALTHALPHAPMGTYALTPAGTYVNRNGIVVKTPGIAGQIPAQYGCEAKADGLFDQADDGQHRACNFLNWTALLAYLDWAGLRPLTELEFEKAARGPARPTPGAFAWATPELIDANSLLFDGTETERVSEQANAWAGLASHGYIGPQGPLRNGFGATDSSDRLQAGGSYFGLWELSGNVWELCVNLDTIGRTFSGLHGDGQIDAYGAADVPGWPLDQGGGYRGGAFNSGIIGPFRDLAISDRFYASLHPTQVRNTAGGRGGRSFPGPQSSDTLTGEPTAVIYRGGAGGGYAQALWQTGQLAQEPTWIQQLRIYPNPSLGQINLSIKGNPPAFLILEVWNMQGQLCLRQRLNQAQSEITLQGFPAGTYHLRLLSRTGYSFEKKLVLYAK